MKATRHTLPIFYSWLAIYSMLAVGCVGVVGVDPAADAKKLLKESIERSNKLQQERKVNENWEVGSTTDPVNRVKRTFAGTFAYRMDSDGKPYNDKSIPFQVYFIGASGPHVLVGFNTYPGRSPVVRVDDNAAVTVNHDGGVSETKPDSNLVILIRKGKIARARYHVWPTGAEDIYVDLTGFEQAWKKLLEVHK